MVFSVNNTNISTPTIQIVSGTTQKLVRRLSEALYLSRKQCSLEIRMGAVAVNNITSYQNIVVRDTDSVTLRGAPVPPHAPPRLWGLNKPRGISGEWNCCSRLSLSNYLRKVNPNKPTPERLISVDPLRTEWSGVTLLTNSSDLATVLRSPEAKLRKEYELSVNGKLPNDGFKRFRSEIVPVDGIKYTGVGVTVRGNNMIVLGFNCGGGVRCPEHLLLSVYGLSITKCSLIRFGTFVVNDKAGRTRLMALDIPNSLLDLMPRKRVAEGYVPIESVDLFNVESRLLLPEQDRCPMGLIDENTLLPSPFDSDELLSIN